MVCGVSRTRIVDRPVGLGDLEIDRQGPAGRAGRLDGFLDPRAIRTDAWLGAVDDHLRGIDLPVAARLRVGLLARREGRMGERVLPPEIIPVIDRERQRDDVGLAREIGQDRIGGRTRGAALTGEQFEDGPGRLRQSGPNEEGRGRKRPRKTSSVKPWWAAWNTKQGRRGTHFSLRQWGRPSGPGRASAGASTAIAPDFRAPSLRRRWSWPAWRPGR